MSKARNSLAAAVVLLCLFLAHIAFRPPGEAVPTVLAVKDYNPFLSRPNEEGDLGVQTYQRYCAGCHGIEGAGDGPAAKDLDPRPRDFTKGLYKFSSSLQGHQPADEDIFRTITHGLNGTSMPNWRLLPEQDRWALVKLLKSFRKDWSDLAPPVSIPRHELPFDLEDPDGLVEAIEMGQEIYHKVTTCWSCHPGYMEADAFEELTGSAPQEVYAGIRINPKDGIRPPDFKKNKLKSVRTLDDLYRVITAGVPGTDMPSWKVLDAEQLWSLTFYVDSLRPKSIILRKIEALNKAWEEEMAEEEEDESEESAEEEDN